MKIEHLAIWTSDLEKVKNFYVRYFNMKCSAEYVNPKKGFSSYFLYFDGASTRIELMHQTEMASFRANHAVSLGIPHFAIAVGNKMEVDEFTRRLRSDGYEIVGEPRETGDGYYESVVKDCEGNIIEITA